MVREEKEELFAGVETCGEREEKEELFAGVETRGEREEKEELFAGVETHGEREEMEGFFAGVEDPWQSGGEKACVTVTSTSAWLRPGFQSPSSSLSLWYQPLGLPSSPKVSTLGTFFFFIFEVSTSETILPFFFIPEVSTSGMILPFFVP
ncbi:hypothetical protein K439DRAFT_1617917 [Ramaria rubella]|nr:hypothetical protein K439DRAFT_1617917 [Ramaria rubella]